MLKNAKQKQKHRDWIAISVAVVSFVISVASFVFSAISTYYGVILQKDDLRVVFSFAPYVVFDDANKGELIVSGGLGAVFINSGNRAAVVIAARLFVRQNAPSNNIYQVKQCGGVEISFELDPFSIKEKEIVSRQFGLKTDAKYVVAEHDFRQASSTGEYRIPLAISSESKEEVAAVTCIRFFVATPSVAEETRDFQMNQFIRSADGEFFEDGYVPVTCSP
jgi:hypothetical protein